MQLSCRSFRLATYSLTGNKKPGGERIPHPHHLLFEEARNLKGSFDSTTWFYETKKSWVNFDISVIPKNAHKNSTSQSLSLIAKGTVSNPPITFIIKPYLNSPHNMI